MKNTQSKRFREQRVDISGSSTAGWTKEIGFVLSMSNYVIWRVKLWENIWIYFLYYVIFVLAYLY